MPFTGSLATGNSYPGNVVLGYHATVTGAIIPEDNHQTLTLTGTTAYTRSYPRSINQTLTFAGTASYHTIRNRAINQLLTFAQRPAIQGHEYVHQTLAFSSVATYTRIVRRTVSQRLSFTQLARRVGIFTRSVSQTLALTQAVRSGYIRSVHASNALTFTQVAIRQATTRRIHQNLNFVQNVHLQFVRKITIRQRLIINQNAHVSRTLHLSAVQHLQFKELHQYTPLGIITIPFAQYSIVRPCGNEDTAGRFLILESGQDLVVLPNPTWGDTSKATNSVVVKRAMDSTVYSFIKRNILQTLHYDIEMGRVKGVELQRFLRLNAGKSIYLKNWKGEIWYGNVITNPLDYTLRSRYEPEREKMTVTLEFSGIKLN